MKPNRGFKMQELHTRGRGRSLHDSFFSSDSRKKKQKKRSISVEPRFRALAESLPDMVVRFDRKMRCMFVNSVFEEVTGISPSQFYGKTCREAGIPEEVLTSWDIAMARAVETGRNTGIGFSFPQKSGSRDFGGDIIPVFD
ncbi:MAG: PAS domain S-box protein, partial [Desulfosalsimonas sp.]